MYELRRKILNEPLKPVAEYKTDTGRLELRRSFFKNYVKGFETDELFVCLQIMIKTIPHDPWDQFFLFRRLSHQSHLFLAHLLDQ